MATREIIFSGLIFEKLLITFIIKLRMYPVGQSSQERAPYISCLICLSVPNSAFISYLGCLQFLEHRELFTTLERSHSSFDLVYMSLRSLLSLIIHVLSLCKRDYLSTQCRAQPTPDTIKLNYFLLRNIHYLTISWLFYLLDNF